VVAEVEFPSRAEAEAFEPPSWLGRDVTGEAGWSNAELATDGRPG
jgi:CYTH domain-containing protein